MSHRNKYENTMSSYWYILCVFVLLYICYITMKTRSGEHDGTNTKNIVECHRVNFELASKQLALLNWIDDSV